MLPIYLSYFAGGSPEQSPRRVLKNALAFVLGFTVLFVLMGGFAGTIGALFSRYQTAVNVVCGLVVICFGLHFLDSLTSPFFVAPGAFTAPRTWAFSPPFSSDASLRWGGLPASEPSWAPR